MISERTHIILLPARITGWKGHNVAIDLCKNFNRKKSRIEFYFSISWF